MRLSIVSPQVILVLLAVGCALPQGDVAKGTNRPEYPALAKVTTYSSTSVGGEDSTRTKINESLAFVVEKDGHLLTTYHTLLDATGHQLVHAIEVELVGGRAPRRYDASIISVEPTIDIAILKIQPDRELRASKIIDRDKIEAGQGIHAVAGFEAGKPVLTSGTIVQLNSMECYQDSMSGTMLEALISIPDSALGGPIFNDSGEVVALHNGYVPPLDAVHDGDVGDRQWGGSARRGRLMTMP